MFSINDNHTFLEMALVGTTSDNIEIRVYGKEGNIPHFHFDHIQSKRKGCIRIDVAEYFDHGDKYKDRLTNKEIKNLILWLKSDKTVFKKFGSNITIYDYIKILWDDNNPNYPLKEDYKIPDYEQLKNF